MTPSRQRAIRRPSPPFRTFQALIMAAAELKDKKNWTRSERVGCHTLFLQRVYEILVRQPRDMPIGL